MLFERPGSGETALLVHVDFTSAISQNDSDEFQELARAAGAEVVHFVRGRKDRPDPKYFVGSGKVAELLQLVKDLHVELVIFNHDLSPSQERNLEHELKCRVLGRTGLILDIFAQRARTHEGKLQVELAQLQHMATRLVRGWTHLERQKGGIGLRGPGETQLESDRRLLRGRIKSIQRRLEKVRSQRAQGRRARDRADLPTISLVGYTNAGKSTLFNTLTDAKVLVRNQLFATLDPTMRRVDIKEVGPIVLADTVGFVSNLPHTLVEAFRATLEEAAQADLLLQVIDISDDAWNEQGVHVDEVLEEIEADELPRIRVFNKIDRVENLQPRIEYGEDGKPSAVWVSAVKGLGIDLLKQAIAEHTKADQVEGWYVLKPQQGRLLARLHELSAVQRQQYKGNGDCEVLISIKRPDWLRTLHQEGLAEQAMTPLQS